MDDSPTPPHKPENPPQAGPFLGIIIIVILIALGGIYFLIKKEAQLRATPPVGQEQANS